MSSVTTLLGAALPVDPSPAGTKAVTVDNRPWPGVYAISIHRDATNHTLQSIVVSGRAITLPTILEVHQFVTPLEDKCIIQIGGSEDEWLIRAPGRLISYTTAFSDVLGWSYRAEFSTR